MPTDGHDAYCAANAGSRDIAIWWAMNGQPTRRWAFYVIGASMCDIDTGRVHGPLLFGERHVHWREQPFTGQRVAGTTRTV
jgi:hypothetical protein